jgi:DNA-binding response OmpR family regulator
VLKAKGISLDLESLTVSSGTSSIELTKNEARILACLMKRELCTREEIIEDLWNNSLYIDENTLYVNINRLRSKLKAIGCGHLITTARGVGYRL